MATLFDRLLEIDMIHVIALVLFVVVVYLIMTRPYGFGMLEGFNDGWNLSSSTSLENSHGSAPAGVNALPGKDQHDQNAHAPHVNRVNQINPQGTHPELKKQPGFSY
jgi:hypothetical protein|uniref:Uncharacterized protein n=1 Tax=viral metagenome TaxID=1070528 RepID=A0A6C0DDZ4_9ZZZZ